MTGWEWVFVLTVVIGWIIVYRWLKRRTKLQLDEADQLTRRKFERSHSQIAAITSLGVGAMFVIAMLVSWPKVPAGNEPFVMGFVGFGFALILYGAYKLYRSRR
jgi:hypothetical protein